MSAPTLQATPTTNGKPTSPMEYVLGLAAEDKEDILIALIREVIAFNGGGKGLIPIETPEGESLGYFVPPLAAAARAAKAWEEMPPEVRAKLSVPVPPGKTYSADEMRAFLRPAGESTPR